MGLIGEECPGCLYCVHSDKENMKCFPNSEDCKKKYDLDQSDFDGPCRCDFFERRY